MNNSVVYMHSPVNESAEKHCRQEVPESRCIPRPRASRESVMKLASKVGATVTYDKGHIVVVVNGKEHRYRKYIQAYQQLYSHKRGCK